MTNKRPIALFLALMLTLSLGLGALAIELPSSLGLDEPNRQPAEITVEEERLNVFSSAYSYQVEFSAILRNGMDTPAIIGRSVVELLDKEGQMLGSIDLYGSEPFIVPAGGVAYLQGAAYGMSDEDAQRVVSHSLKMAPTVASEMEAQMQETILPAQAELMEKDGFDYLADQPTKELFVQAAIENNTQEAAFEPALIVVMRDKDGKMLAIVRHTVSSIGIPPGGQVLVRPYTPDGLIKALQDAGTPVAGVEALAMLPPDLY